MLSARAHRFTLEREWKLLISSLAALVIGVIPANVRSSDFAEQQQLVDNAKLTVDAFTANPELGEAVREDGPEIRAIFIVPQFFRVAFLFGGAGGSGVLLVRDEKNGEWSQPAFYHIGSASFGLQAGADALEIVVVVRTRKGLEGFYRSNFTLGLNTGITIGPKGEAGAVHGIMADTVSYARSKGAFVGMALAGAVVSVSDESNTAYYGRPLRPTDILVKGDVKNDQSVSLRESVARLMEVSTK